jgi:hypothetical protein
MLQLRFTNYGLAKLNNVLVEPNTFFDIKSIKGNWYGAELDDKTLMDSITLPMPVLDGYVNSAQYNPDPKSITIQAIFPKDLPIVNMNGVGLFDSSDKMVAYAIHPVYVRYSGTVLRYLFWISMFNQNNEMLNDDKVQIVLPDNQVVHHTYSFVAGTQWLVKHHLDTPFVNFNVFDSDYKLISPERYEAIMNTGYIYLDFKGAIQSGFVSVIGEGFSFSIKGDSIDRVAFPDATFSVNSDIPWIVGTLLD